MTISVFWEIVKPVAQTISFKELCIKEGFVQKHRNIGTMIFGVDAYLWITQCQAVFHKPRHAQMGKNPELKALFYKLAALNQAGVTAVFVFDGPNKPSVKRDKQVRAKPHWLVAEFIKLIELFGFHYHMAPGEADSELGYLDNFGCIDGILTDDGDVAVFGASRIIRKMNKDIPDEITVYTSESFKNDIGLTRGGILLLAILGGGDYDTVGLAGCGSHIALALAHCGFGDSLLQASENMAEAELEEFLIQWREDLRTELATNSRGFLRSKQNTLSTKIPETFPSLRVLSLYVQPTTSWSNGFVPPATDKWIVKLPALPELAVYCNKEFGWNPAAIAEKFRRLIFSGLCTRRLTMPLNIEQQIHNHVIKGRIQEEHPPLSAFVNILRVSPASEETSKKYQVKIVIGGLGQWSLSRLDAPSAAAASLSATTNEWIAAPLVERYFPLMVNAFNQALHLPLLPVPTAAVAPKYVEIPDSPEAQPVAKKWLGSIDLTNDKGEGGSVNQNAAGQAHGVIDLTADSDEDVEIIDLD